MLRLTSESKQHLQTGVPISDLGPTFRHAVEVARSVGAPYIWIDALCVIQDSKEDWLREVPRMMDVYGAALFNIVATSAADTDARCYPRNDPRSVKPFVVTRKGTDFPDARYILYDRQYRRAAFKDMPLLRRGWVVQELLLAPRVLHFCATEMFWECFELIASETYQSCLPPSMDDLWIPRAFAWKAFRSLPGHSGNALTNGNAVTQVMR